MKWSNFFKNGTDENIDHLITTIIIAVALGIALMEINFTQMMAVLGKPYDPHYGIVGELMVAAAGLEVGSEWVNRRNQKKSEKEDKK